jgi:hypothetical protein
VPPLPPPRHPLQLRLNKAAVEEEEVEDVVVGVVVVVEEEEEVVLRLLMVPSFLQEMHRPLWLRKRRRRHPGRLHPRVIVQQRAASQEQRKV